MNPDLPPPPTLFSVANRFYRENRFENAGVIYEFLRESYPDFAPYAQNEKSARKKLGKNPNKKFHFNKATDFNKRLRVADLLSEYNDPQLINLCFNSFNLPPCNQHLLAKASATANVDFGPWLSFVNAYLATNKLAPVSLRPLAEWIGPNPFLNLVQAKLTPVYGPLVSIGMSCYNAEPYIEHAVSSILGQNYKNIELLIFNDHSKDNTLSILRRIEKMDNRVKVFDNAVNQGTYVSRNEAFSRAKGDFFTIMDGDDFALPERIGLQVQHLQANPSHIGVLTEWVRMNEDGRFHFKNFLGGVYQHEAVATLMVRTKEVRKKVGFWDSVRFAADTEFLFRLRKVYGDESVQLLNIPTAISLYHESSLTCDPVTGINVPGFSGLSPVRIAYRDAWMNWHQSESQPLFIPFPLKKRLFEASTEMLIL